MSNKRSLRSSSPVIPKAIIYEFVPGKPQDLAVCQSHLDFFHALGFALEAYKPDNWHGGRLIGLNDICSPLSDGWRRTAVHPRDANKCFWSLDFVRGSTCSHKIVLHPLDKVICTPSWMDLMIISLNHFTFSPTHPPDVVADYVRGHDDADLPGVVTTSCWSTHGAMDGRYSEGSYTV